MHAADAPVTVGQVLAGRYQVERVLGTGGMGIVVAAVDSESGETVAVKVMSPRPGSPANLSDLVTRFNREAAAVRRLRSEHVAKVTDAGTLPSGAPFLVMEYLKGCDLWTHLKKSRRLPCATAVDLVLQACDAVAEAHTLGIVHRDLKPANMFLTMRPDGSALVKVLDFGISKAMPSDDTLSATELILTGTLTVVGSPHYMAPEQMLSSKSVDERADLYSLGVILYLFISGVHPFQAQTLPELCAKVLREPPRPLWEVAPEALPPGLEEVVMRCLAKDPGERYPTVAAFVRALAPFAATRPPDLTDLVRLPEELLDHGSGTSPSIDLSHADLFDFDPDESDTEKPRPGAAAQLSLFEATFRVHELWQSRRPVFLAAGAALALIVVALVAVSWSRPAPERRLPTMVVNQDPAPPVAAPPAPVAISTVPAPTASETPPEAAAPRKTDPIKPRRRAKAPSESDLLRKRR